MRLLDNRRLKIALTFTILVIVLLYLLSLDTITFSRYESTISSTSGLSTAIYLVNDEYQTVSVKLPDVIPSNRQYKYTFSVSNYNDDEHCETNLKYRVHIRATTNMPIVYDLYKVEDLEDDLNDAETYILDNDDILDSYGTYFKHIYTEENTFYFDEDNIDYYVLVFTFPDDTQEGEYNYEYNSNIDYIEINIESQQILSTDV